MADPRRALLLIQAPTVAARIEKALASRGLRAFRFPDAVDPIALCDFGRPDLAVVALEQAAAATQLSAGIRNLGIPVLLVAPVAGLLEVNALRKASKASLALPSSFADEDLAMALDKLAPGGEPPAPALAEPVPASAAAAVVTPEPAPAPQRTIESEAPEEPAFAIARAGLRKFSGELRFTTPELVRSIRFAAGTLVSCASNVPTERLGNRLLEKGKVARPQLNKALTTAKEKSIQLGASLVELGLLDEATLATELAAQHLDRALALFAMPAGRTRLEPQEVVAGPVLVSAERLLLEGVRRHYPFARLKSVLHDKHVFRTVPGADVESAGFSPGELEALGLVDGSRTVSEVAARAKNLLDALRAMYVAALLEILR